MLPAAMILLLTLSVPVQVDEARVHALEAQLMAPCCWSQTVDVHHSPAAEEMTAEIERLVAAGRTDEEIRARFVSQYGTRILVEPPAEGFAATLYVVPIVALVLSAVGLPFVLRRLTQTRAGVAAPPPGPVAAPGILGDRLDDELRSMD